MLKTENALKNLFSNILPMDISGSQVEVESSDSVPTSEEYEVVKEQSPSPDPGL